ncbi:hypothetical protein GW891_01505 [bacterium]|nr:hypothetical protein [bacterium]
MASITNSGKQESREVRVISGLYVVPIFHNLVEGFLFKKSHTNCAGALKFEPHNSYVAFSHFL